MEGNEVKQIEMDGEIYWTVTSFNNLVGSDRGLRAYSFLRAKNVTGNVIIKRICTTGIADHS